MPNNPITAVARNENIQIINLTATNTAYTLPTGGGLLPNDRFMYGINLTFEGRATNPASGNPTALMADYPWSLIENIIVSGTHRLRNQAEQFINIRGADLAAYNNIYGGYFPYVEPSAGRPNFTPTGSVSANGTNDFRFVLFIPFTPMNVPLSQQVKYLLDAPNWDNLKLQIQFSDALNAFSGQSTQPTFSSYGSSSGSPRVIVDGLFALGGQSFQGLSMARQWLYSQEITSGEISNNGVTATNVRLMSIPRGNKIRSMLLKTGTKGSVTAGNNSYATLTTPLANIKVFRGLNKQIRSYVSQYTCGVEVHEAYKMFPKPGYTLIDFVLRGRLDEAFDTTGLIAGPSGDTDCYLQADVTGATSQALSVLFTELKGETVRIR